VIIIGCRVRTAEPHLSKRKHDQGNAQHHEDITGDDKEPVEMSCQKIPGGFEKGAESGLENQRENGERDKGQCQYAEDRIVNVELENKAFSIIDVVLADLVIGLDDLGCTLRLRERICRIFRVGNRWCFVGQYSVLSPIRFELKWNCAGAHGNVMKA